MNQESKQVTAPQKDANHILGKNWRPMSSRDIICRYIADHIAIIQEGKNLEIEIRLGTISFKAIKRVNPDVVYNTTHYLSHQNPMIIGSTYPFVQQALKFKGNCYSQEVSHRFNPTISETLFLSRIQTIKEQREFLQEKSQFSIDYFPKRNKDTLGRFTYDLETGEYLQTVKEGKSSLDVMHQGLCYRIGASNEVDTKLSRDSFLKQINTHGVGYGRIKIRKSFTFQFMEFSFTKSFELKEIPEINQISYYAKKDKPENLEEIKSQALTYCERQGLQASHEVEIEIIDINFLKDLLKKDQIGFSKIIERMMRNAEGLAHYPDEFHLKEYRELFDEKIIEYPFCGEYLNSINKLKRNDGK